MVGEAICCIRRECELELRLGRLTLCSHSRLRHTGLRFCDTFGLERARGGFDPTGANRLCGVYLPDLEQKRPPDRPPGPPRALKPDTGATAASNSDDSTENSASENSAGVLDVR
jgi:hypothetical protein